MASSSPSQSPRCLWAASSSAILCRGYVETSGPCHAKQAQAALPAVASRPCVPVCGLPAVLGVPGCQDAAKVHVQENRDVPWRVQGTYSPSTHLGQPPENLVQPAGPGQRGQLRQQAIVSTLFVWTLCRLMSSRSSTPLPPSTHIRCVTQQPPS